MKNRAKYLLMVLSLWQCICTSQAQTLASTDIEVQMGGQLGVPTAQITTGIDIQQQGNDNSIHIAQIGANQQISGTGSLSAPIYGNRNEITINQGDKISHAGQNAIRLGVNGDYNNMDMNQGNDITGSSLGNDAGMHYQDLQVSGSYNSIATSQIGQSNYAAIGITGNNNRQSLVQLGSGATALTNITGNNNDVNTTQSGSGNHWLSVSLIGDGNAVSVNQSGSLQNKANISLINAGGPSSVSLIQTGGQTYSITQTCVTPSGCGTLTIKQGN
jgi:hypothetical protein